MLVLAAVVLAASPAGGTIAVFTAGGHSIQTVLVAGAIGDSGTATSVDANGKADPNGNFEQIKLQKGSFLVNAAKFNAAGNRKRPFVASNTAGSTEPAAGPRIFAPIGEPPEHPRRLRFRCCQF